MHRQEVEEDRVARLQLEAADVEGVPVGLDVRQFGEAPVREPLRLPGQECPRHEPGPAVRAGQQFQAAGRGHRIHRYPSADAVPVDVVVGLVLVPGGALPGSAFFHQHMIVVEPYLRRSHQRRGDLWHAGVAGQPLDLRDVLPAAEVLSE